MKKIKDTGDPGTQRNIEDRTWESTPDKEPFNLLWQLYATNADIDYKKI